MHIIPATLTGFRFRLIDTAGPWLGALSIAIACVSPAAARISSALKGTATLARIDVGTACSYPQPLIRCTESGVFKSSLGRANATYAWTWNLPASGSEVGRLTLTFAKAASLVLKMRGSAKPTNPIGSLKAVGRWRVASGTGKFARAAGGGAYVFLSIENRGVTPVTRTGSITISGTIS